MTERAPNARPLSIPGTVEDDVAEDITYDDFDRYEYVGRGESTAFPRIPMIERTVLYRKPRQTKPAKSGDDDPEAHEARIQAHTARIRSNPSWDG